MKKIFNIILAMPFFGLLCIYIYVLLAVISSNSKSFYNFDPKEIAIINFLYAPFSIIFIFGLFVFIPLGLLLLLIDFVKFKGNLTSNFFKWLYIVGVVLTIFLNYYDIGGCQFWFFD